MTDCIDIESRKRSLSALEVLIHYHVSLQDHPRRMAPAVCDALSMWEREGMLEKTIENGVELFTTTERAHVFLEHLCQLPLPHPMWPMK